MAKYNVKVGEWITPSETTGSIQNLGSVPIEISATNDANTGIKVESGQMVNFEGTVYVRSAGTKTATFTTVPFKVIAGGGGGGGGGTYTLPTASDTVKGGIRIGAGLTMTGELMSVDKQISAWASNKQYNIDDIVIVNNKLYKCTLAHTSSANFNTDISNWVAIKSDIAEWQNSTNYVVGSAVIYDNILYICKTAHLSTSSFDTTKWNKIGEEVITKLENWATSIDYKLNQLVYYGNSVYRCKEEHTSDVFSTDISKWEQIYADLKDWQANTYYPVGTIVINDNIMYSCNTAHTSGVSFVSTNWTVLSGAASSQLPDWAASTHYNVDDIVYYNGVVYRCTNAHTSTSVFDTNKFAFIVSSATKVNDWATSTLYRENDVVYAQGSIYRCNTEHTSDNFNTDSSKWTLLFANLDTWKTLTYYTIGRIVISGNKIYMCKTAHLSGANFDATMFDLIGEPNGANTFNDWATSTAYVAGQIVQYAGSIYRCNTDHTSDSTSFATDIAKWDLITADLKLWAVSTYYGVGACVINGNSIYRCTTAHTSTSSFDATKWAKVDGADANINPWTTSTDYSVGDIVYYDNVLYVCKTAHTSDVANFDRSKWNLFSIVTAKVFDWTTNVYYEVNQCVLYNDNIYRCVIAHTSSVFSTDNANWQLVYASIKTWIASTYYSVGSIVINSNKIYRCKTAHISELSFDATELANWDMLSGDSAVITEWKTNTAYTVGTLVVNGDNIYRCIYAHTSSVWNSEISNWETLDAIQEWQSNTNYYYGQLITYQDTYYRVTTAFTSGSAFNDTNLSPIKIGLNWKPNYSYGVGALVVANDKWYRCTTAHTSGESFNDTNWMEVSACEATIKAWVSSTDYALNDLVSYNGNIYKCTTAHTSGSTFDATEEANWTNLVTNGTSISDWVTSTPYNVGDMVLHSNKLYKCTTQHTSSVFATDISNWTAVEIGKIQTWAANTFYDVGEFIYYNHNLYRALRAFTSDSTFDVVDTHDNQILEVLGANELTDTDIQDILDSFDAEGENPVAKSEIYTTTEKRIGTWIDGKPLYQITIQDTMPTVTTDGTRADKTISIASLNVDTGVSIDGMINNSNSFGYTCLNSWNNSQSYSVLSFDKTTVSNDSIWYASSRAVDSQKPVYITLKYTKTTD